ncbi:MAG: bifunctional 4-hydroxy-3-methylbut-2-enyl diphosphate reductase/30S ribosomal protein S1 [Tissierellaceae bacterium]|nr:bifunctional 4-hydroxy-3-methylbut-2-enyl diphosphate reductase/30S ribosomal protein S1 [Tissierellaceae bacterium]
MKIIIADHSGFCFGVKRAVDTTISELELDANKIYSYGPLIHNPQEVDRLEGKGLQTIDNYSNLEDGRIIIRSHGVPKNLEEEMNSKGFSVIDSTCPYVKAVHKRVEDYSFKGYNIVIIGDSKHPEVIGISGYSQNKVYVVNSVEDVNDLPEVDKICVVSQTTNTKEKFDTLSEAIKKKGDVVEIFNTICNATKNRQESAKEVAQMVDAMVVIGGYSSSNTKKLVEISKKYCDNVYHIESIKDLSLQELSKFNTIGITAGASTPDWIIKEAVEAMDNINNNEMNSEMMEAIENTFTRIHHGDVIKGKVIFVTNNEVMVNINYKSDGIITKDELSSDPNVNPKDLYKEGDDIYVYVIKNDDGEGNVVLSARRVEDIKNWDALEENFNNKDTVEAKVDRVVKGGLIAVVKGINGFIPASHASAKYVSDLESFKGQTFEVIIIDFDKEKRRLVLSRKAIEKDELKIKRDAVWASLEENKIIEGTVQRITDFGAFVDLGGVDGLIHISDLSWHRVKHPSEVVKPGDKVEVQVLSFDKEKNRISLGLKQTIEEPWVAFTNKVNIGDVVEGKVVNLLDFGAFVRLESGVDGLLHVSQISKEHVAKPSDVLSVGQTIEVKVIDINNEDRKISLSMKEASNEEEQEAEEKTSAEELSVNEDIETTIEDIINNK